MVVGFGGFFVVFIWRVSLYGVLAALVASATFFVCSFGVVGVFLAPYGFRGCRVCFFVGFASFSSLFGLLKFPRLRGYVSGYLCRLRAAVCSVVSTGMVLLCGFLCFFGYLGCWLIDCRGGL